MPFDIQLTGSPPILLVTVSGTIDAEACQAILLALAAQAPLHGDPPVLVDTRPGTAATSATDIYQLISDLAERGFGRRNRMAIVTPVRPDFDRAAFLEELARHRGMAIRGFRDPDEARRWLLE